MSSGIVEPTRQQAQQEAEKQQQQAGVPTRSKLVQRLLDASASLPAFMKDLLTTQAVVVAGTEACAFLVERQGDRVGMRLIHHIRPDDSDQETRQNAIRAFQKIIEPCVAQRKDGAIEVGSPDGGDSQYCLVTVLRNEGEVVAASAVITRCKDMDRAKQRLTSMQLVAGYFELFSLRRYVEQARSVADRHQQVLQFASAVATAEGFESASMGLCNEIAARTGATRVALGWLKGNRIRVKALSHTEKFDKKQELIVSLERVMEECVDQEEPVKFDPDGDSSQNVTRMAREHSVKQAGVIVYSTPLRRRDEIVGVMTLEFPPRHKLDPQAEAAVAVGSELLAPQLYDRHHNDMWLPVKAWHSFKNVGKLIGDPRYTLAKVLIVLAIALGLFVTFFKMTYKVHAGFEFKAQEKRLITAPFDGRLEEVLVRPGHPVREGQVLARLDVEEDRKRYFAELSQYNAKDTEARQLQADGKVAEAYAAWAEAQAAMKRAEVLKFQIDRAELKAPTSGMLAKGDLRDKLGKHVSQGEVLFEIFQGTPEDPRRVPVEVELLVADRDIQEVQKVAAEKREFHAMVSSTSYPGREHKVLITRIVPTGEPKDGQNVFKVYGTLVDEQEPWMTAGLTGEARIHTDERPLYWIWTHRLADWVRLKLWI